MSSPGDNGEKKEGDNGENKSTPPPKVGVFILFYVVFSSDVIEKFRIFRLRYLTT